MAALFRANGWDTAKNLYGPSSYNVLTIVNSRKGLQGRNERRGRGLPSSLKDEKAFIEERGAPGGGRRAGNWMRPCWIFIEFGPIEYCDLFHEGCPSC